MSRKTVFYIAFFGTLVLAFFFIISQVIPGFTESRLPPIGTVNSFSFTNQDGKQVTEKDVAGKVFVTEYFFTTCRGICPQMNTNMKKVYEEYKNTDGFLILSHTCDPANDSAARLKRYADSLGVDTKKWVFLTGTKDSLYNMARYSYKIDDPNDHPQQGVPDFLHSQFFALVDKKGHVRKIYDGLKPGEVNRLIRDINKLLHEKS